MFDDDPRVHSTFVHPPGRNTAPLIEVRNVNLWYGETQALRDVSFDLYPSEILAFIGPSGCGKSSALKCLNRMHEATPGTRMTGTILMEGLDIHRRDLDPSLHRRRFGWVAQKPNPFPRTVYDNVAEPARLHGLAESRADLDALVESCLRRADLWDEVKDGLHGLDGTELSGGQQQRLCIARALAQQPDVLLMDEPTGSIDPIATARIENLLQTLRADHSIVVITHSMMEARRLADRVAYFHLGRLLEIGPTADVFLRPGTEETRRFIEGRTG